MENLVSEKHVNKKKREVYKEEGDQQGVHLSPRSGGKEVRRRPTDKKPPKEF